MVEALKSLDAQNKKVLILTSETDENFLLSFRNLPNVLGYTFNDMNTYDIVNSGVLFLMESAATKIAEDYKELNATN